MRLGQNAKLLLALAILAMALFAMGRFMLHNEVRQGAALADPVLAVLKPIDLTWPIFLLIYGAIIITCLALRNDQRQMTFAVLAYALLMVMRMCVMFLTPLEPPAGMIVLRDPVVEIFATSRSLNKDLFFSGHTSLLSLLTLVQINSRLKILFFVMTVLVGSFLMIQHVHYSLDVVCAPFFAYGSWRIIHFLLAELKIQGNS